MGRFFAWVGRGIGNIRDLFPFGHEGRQTLIYVMFSWSVVVLTILIKWILAVAERHGQWVIFGEVANKMANALIISVVAYAAFVSIRAAKIGKDGASFESKDNEEARGAQKAATAAQDKADDLKDNSSA